MTLQKEVCYAMKMTSKMVNHHKMTYPVNETMKEYIDFLLKALEPEWNIKFKTPIAHMIPRTPTASLFGDSSLTGCRGYLLDLKFWWHKDFPYKNCRVNTIAHPRQVRCTIHINQLSGVFHNHHQLLCSRSLFCHRIKQKQPLPSGPLRYWQH